MTPTPMEEPQIESVEESTRFWCRIFGVPMPVSAPYCEACRNTPCVGANCEAEAAAWAGIRRDMDEAHYEATDG